MPVECLCILFRAKENMHCFHDGEKQFANWKVVRDTSEAIYFHYNLLYMNAICTVSSDRCLKYSVSTSAVY